MRKLSNKIANILLEARKDQYKKLIMQSPADGGSDLTVTFIYGSIFTFTWSRTAFLSSQIGSQKDG